mmetsp:Transcript_26902/g.69758  ORF Transcript_26902/g.69758 Transcript_26902/m.69758 type:complete len:353 (-) Transcript_26902:165-1223(-)
MFARWPGSHGVGRDGAAALPLRVLRLGVLHAQQHLLQDHPGQLDAVHQLLRRLDGLRPAPAQPQQLLQRRGGDVVAEELRQPVGDVAGAPDASSAVDHHPPGRLFREAELPGAGVVARHRVVQHANLAPRQLRGALIPRLDVHHLHGGRQLLLPAAVAHGPGDAQPVDAHPVGRPRQRARAVLLQQRGHHDQATDVCHAGGSAILVIDCRLPRETVIAIGGAEEVEEVASAAQLVAAVGGAAAQVAGGQHPHRVEMGRLHLHERLGVAVVVGTGEAVGDHAAHLHLQQLCQEGCHFSVSRVYQGAVPLLVDVAAVQPDGNIDRLALVVETLRPRSGLQRRLPGIRCLYGSPE